MEALRGGRMTISETLTLRVRFAPGFPLLSSILQRSPLHHMWPRTIDLL